MVWAKLDDGILDNPKIAQVGPIGYALYTAGLVYCNRNLTDGFIPYGHARSLLPTVWTDARPSNSEYPSDQEMRGPRVWSLSMTCGMVGQDGIEVIEAMIELLCLAELWTAEPGGYRVHDFAEWNPSKDKVLAERAAARERVKKFRRNKGGVTREVTPEVTDELRENFEPGSLSPVPEPEPEPEPEPSDLTSKTPALRAIPKERPDEDQLYLAERISEAWDRVLSVKALQKLNSRFGRVPVTDALRQLHGFPPSEAIRSPYAYLLTICKQAAS